MDLSSIWPDWGSKGDKPSDGKDYEKGDNVKAGSLDYLWYYIKDTFEKVETALSNKADDPHDNASHSENYAVDGDTQPPATHDNTAHSENYITSGDVDGGAPDPHDNTSHSEHYTALTDQSDWGLNLQYNSINDAVAVTTDLNGISSINNATADEGITFESGTNPTIDVFSQTTFTEDVFLSNGANLGIGNGALTTESVDVESNDGTEKWNFSVKDNGQIRIAHGGSAITVGDNGNLSLVDVNEIAGAGLQDDGTNQLTTAQSGKRTGTIDVYEKGIQSGSAPKVIQQLPIGFANEFEVARLALYDENRDIEPDVLLHVVPKGGGPSDAIASVSLGDVEAFSNATNPTNDEVELILENNSGFTYSKLIAVMEYKV